MDWNILLDPGTKSSIRDLCSYIFKDRVNENYNKWSIKWEPIK